jgi:putative hydrolase of the HAD superfamily
VTTRQPALIFDFGNVLAYFDYSLACERYGRRIGLTGEAFLDLLRERGLNPLVASYERGELSSEEFSAGVCRIAGVEIAHDDFVTAWADIFRLNEPVAELVRSLKAGGFTLVLGSNTNAIHAGHFRRQFAEVLGHFDRLVLSYEIGHIKPSRAFYEACAQAARRPPGECIFIDDLAENVEGARLAGLRAIQFQDLPALLTELRGHGVTF